MTSDISVVVVSYNAREWLERCLDSVDRTTAAGRSVEVVVVDNASTAPVRQFLGRRPGIRLLQLEQNIGFARAANAGVAASHGDTVVLLNPDAVLHAGALDALVDFLDEEPRRGIVGGRTLRPDGTVDPSSCWGRPTLWSWFCAAVGLSAAFRRSPVFDPESMGRWDRDSPREVDVVTGCLLACARSTWETLGGFDPAFFMYGEDAELSIRARRTGLRPSITPDAIATHGVGASSPDRLSKLRLLFRGKATLARRLWAPLPAFVALRLLQAHVGLRALSELVRRPEQPVMRHLWKERAEWTAGWETAA